MNGDEAAVLGAGFRAATLSKLFRVREILVKDKNYENVDISYTADGEFESCFCLCVQIQRH